MNHRLWNGLRHSPIEELGSAGWMSRQPVTGNHLLNRIETLMVRRSKDAIHA